MNISRKVFLDHHIYVKYPWLVFLDEGVSINRGVEFYPDFLGKHKIVLGKNVRVAPYVRFHAAGHDYSNTTYNHTGGDILVGNNVWIGTGSVILPGVKIGQNSVIGAGSIVTKKIPPNSVAVGVPAKVIRARKA